MGRGYRTETRARDAKKLDILQKGLERKGLYTLREKEIFNKEFQHGVRFSDLYFKDKDIVLEHNTNKTHGELGFENVKTFRKYADYLRGKQWFFIVNEDLCKELKLDQVNQSIYLYYHTLALKKAEYEV